jgi:hypothetical protein
MNRVESWMERRKGKRKCIRLGSGMEDAPCLYASFGLHQQNILLKNGSSRIHWRCRPL